LSTVATVPSEELQVTDVVRSWVVRSEYVPVARNCWVVPRAILLVTGVTVMESSVAAVTVRDVESTTPVPGSAAVIVVIPVLNEVAKPLKPAALSTVATDPFEELQVTAVVRSWVVKSE
jgi:hypothetical protein